MPCALPPVDQSSSQLGWGDGVFYARREPGRPRQAPTPHRGIDFMADAGAPVVAPWQGTVVAKGLQNYGDTPTLGADALGHWIVISHGSVVAGQPPIATRYAHLRAPSTLNVGDRVAMGDLIGFVGASGRAPERRDRPLLFFQALQYNPDTNWARGMGVPRDALRDFFNPLGVSHEGGQRPGPTVDPYEQVPVWGGQLVQHTSCGGLGVGIDPRRQQPLYARYGRTQLSNRAPYAPARYADLPSSASGGALVVGLGLAAALGMLLFRPSASKAPPWWVRQRRHKRQFAGLFDRNDKDEIIVIRTEKRIGEKQAPWQDWPGVPYPKPEDRETRAPWSGWPGAPRKRRG